MEFLAGYGSDDGSEPSSPEHVAQLAPVTSAPAVESEHPGPSFRLPPPKASQVPLFSGVAPPKRQHKLPKARFGVPIDFGGVTPDVLEKMQEAPAKLAPAAQRSSRLADLLPSPKNVVLPPRSGKGTAYTAGGASDDEDELKALGANDGTAMTLGPGGGDNEVLEQLGDGVHASTSGRQLEGTGAQAPHADYYASQGMPAPAGPDVAAFTAAGIQFKEVNGAALRYMDPGQRAELNAMRSALGSDYEARLRKEAGPDVGKMQKRKHQIGSLFQQAKLQELEMLEKHAAGIRNKTETKRKYGWA
uniref:Proline-rich protein PRCC n=1 Tax=Auxenochlorella protothecoides TaxID=3075 RepID=A0A1D2AI10_AUXPR